MGSFNLGDALLQIVALVFSIVFHEVSHGWVAEKHGDPTARYMGRLTLNPIPHIDPVGSVILPLFLKLTGAGVLFGWAKPVPVDVRNLRNPKLDGIKVALAGPVSNLLLATVCAVAFAFTAVYLPSVDALGRLFAAGVQINCLLAMFNLLPIPPLDGSWVLEHTLKGQAYNVYRQVRPYGMLILVVILFIPVLQAVLIQAPVGYVLGIFQSLVDLIQGWLR